MRYLVILVGAVLVNNFVMNLGYVNTLVGKCPRKCIREFPRFETGV